MAGAPLIMSLRVPVSAGGAISGYYAFQAGPWIVDRIVLCKWNDATPNAGYGAYIVVNEPTSDPDTASDVLDDVWIESLGIGGIDLLADGAMRLTDFWIGKTIPDLESAFIARMWPKWDEYTRGVLCVAGCFGSRKGSGPPVMLPDARIVFRIRNRGASAVRFCLRVVGRCSPREAL